MDVQPNADATAKRRRTWPALGAGTGVIGAAALTFTLVSPLGTSSAGASELTAFDDCDALAQHMSGLALDRILDSRRGFDEYSGRGGTDGVALDGPDAGRAVPGTQPMAVPEAAAGTTAGAGTGVAGTDTAGSAADAAPGAAANSGARTSAEAAPAPQTSSGRVAGSDASDAVGNAASGTNTQEAGVDEADLAKTDGRMLITVRDNHLFLMDVSGRTPRARGSVAMPGQRPLELLLDGNRAIVIGTADSRERYLDDETPAAGRAASDLTTLTVVDLSDPGRPAILSTEEVSARYLSARMTGDTVRIVLSSTPDVLRSARGWDYDDMSVDDVRARLARIPGADWLPMRREVNREARTVSETPLLDCSDVRYPVTDSGMDVLTVLSIDTGLPDAFEQAAATGLIGSGDLVYATADKLFVATTDGGWNGDDGGGWRDNVRRTAGVSTRVHSFDITGDGAEYLASGRVDGYLYGRWAMSESGGLLRLVTTTTAPWDRRGTTQTGVVVLDTAGKRMREIGRVDGMGFTETVRSVRWFDDVAAIVTFRQTDPLYLVDLSRPESPKVRGELKVPGYSSYLHPVGDHRLLGIGQDANSWGQTRGLQVSSFDILDLADPRRTDNLTFGRGTSSPVEQDPRGFVYLPDRRLAILPVFPSAGSFGSICPPDAGCALPTPMPAPMRDGPGFAPERTARNGLVAVRVTGDGTLRTVASWYSEDGSGRVVKLIPLADGRLVALDYRGVRIFDAESLKLFGSASYR